MRPTLAFVVALASCAGPAPPPPEPRPPPIAVMPAPDAAPVEEDARLIVPCAPTSAAAKDARTTLDAIGTRIDALAADAPHEGLVHEIDALLQTRCYALAREDGVAKLRWSSALSLRTWWTSGGRDFLASYLSLDDHADHRYVVIPPTPRGVLTLDAARADDPLRPLLCPAKAFDDRSCGIETAGWRMRVDHAQQHVTDSGDRGDYCARRLKEDTSGASPYAVFRQCLEDGAGEDVLPLGALQAPKDGWFVVAWSVFIVQAGCRGEVAAYDLATGAAYTFGCRGSPPARLAIGRVSTGALREAAWMSMLQHTNESHVRLNAGTYGLPDGVPMRRRAGEHVESRRLIISGSDAPVVDWAWVRAKGNKLVGQASGRYDTFESSLSAHAGALIRIVEAGFQEGCAPAPPPHALPWEEMGPIVTPGVRPDIAALFSSVDQAKPALASATRPRGNCAMVP